MAVSRLDTRCACPVASFSIIVHLCSTFFSIHGASESHAYKFKELENHDSPH